MAYTVKGSQILYGGSVVAMAEAPVTAKMLAEKLNATRDSYSYAIKALVERLREDEVTWSAAALTRAQVVERLDAILAGHGDKQSIMLTVESAGGGFEQREIKPGSTLHGFFTETNMAVNVRVEWA